MSHTQSLFATIVALVGEGARRWRRLREPEPPQALGARPRIPPPRAQGAIPTLKMPSARGWSDGRLPTAAPGLQVNAFATGLDHPRWIEVLPCGDVTVAESTSIPGRPRTLFGHAIAATMRRAGATGASPNRITLLRDADGDGVAEQRHVLLQGLSQPFGMTLLGDTFYVGNTDALVAFPYTAGSARIDAPGRELARFKPGGHWTRSLLASTDGQRLYVGVGSTSNIGDLGLDAEEGRACIVEVDLRRGTQRAFATGLRNPVGMAWEPRSGALWTVVNERDGLGDETPPDYLTRVQDGGFYGWPWCWWDRVVDDRVPPNPQAVARAITPDYALGGHTASLGLCWVPADTLPGLGEGMAIGQHGSWNRSTLRGYAVVFVPFADGRPAGDPIQLMGGFLSRDEREAYGRPVGVAIGPDRRSLLVADDVGNAIWRLSAM